jgi:hypothetical protein
MLVELLYSIVIGNAKALYDLLRFNSSLCANFKLKQMRTRIQTKVNVENVIQQIECEVKAYSKAIRIIMQLKEVQYKEAKMILERRINERITFKTC